MDTGEPPRMFRVDTKTRPVFQWDSSLDHLSDNLCISIENSALLASFIVRIVDVERCSHILRARDTMTIILYVTGVGGLEAIVTAMLINFARNEFSVGMCCIVGLFVDHLSVF